MKDKKIKWFQLPSMVQHLEISKTTFLKYNSKFCGYFVFVLTIRNLTKGLQILRESPKERPTVFRYI